MFWMQVPVLSYDSVQEADDFLFRYGDTENNDVVIRSVIGPQEFKGRGSRLARGRRRLAIVCF